MLLLLSGAVLVTYYMLHTVNHILVNLALHGLIALLIFLVSLLLLSRAHC